MRIIKNRKFIKYIILSLLIFFTISPVKAFVEDMAETINTKKFLIVEILFIIFDIGYILYVHFNRKESVYKLLIVSVLFIIIIELLKYLLF